MSSIVDICRFISGTSGTDDWIYAGPVPGYWPPSEAGALHNHVYSYRAESATLSQWEVGYGAYDYAAQKLARSTVLYNSEGTTDKINFSTAPQVAIVALAADLAIPDQNVLINGAFRTNQRCYVSGTALTAGKYGHDRWKAGSSGATYTFTQGVYATSIMITAGTLIQVVENCHVSGGTYTLSWDGTALGRVGLNASSPLGGAYASSPITVTGQSAGAIMSVEFSTGTLGKVKLEAGDRSTPFTLPSLSAEFIDCFLYYQKSYARTVAPGTARSAGVGGEKLNYGGNSVFGTSYHFFTRMRATPTLIAYDNAGTPGAISYWDGTWHNGAAPGLSVVSDSTFNVNTAPPGSQINFDWTAEAEL